MTVLKKSDKQAKMGHAKKTIEITLQPCSKGHPTTLVHYINLANMKRWCPTCQEVQ